MNLSKICKGCEERREWIKKRTDEASERMQTLLQRFASKNIAEQHERSDTADTTTNTAASSDDTAEHGNDTAESSERRSDTDELGTE